MLRTLAAACSLALAATLAASLPASAAAAGALVEAEAMTTVAGRSAVFSDAAASARQGRVLLTDGAVRAVLRPTAPAGRLIVRVRGDQAAGAPRAVVLVDGRQVSSVLVSSRTWVEHAVPGRWAAGAHTVDVRFVNDYRSSTGADRNLRLDRVRFEAAPAATTASGTASDDAYEARVVQLVNAERTSRGLRPLAVSACADRYAEAWGVHLAGVRTLVHRTDLGAVLRACSASGVAENIAYGKVTAERLVQLWMASAGHRANILGAYTHVGTGATRTADGTVWATQNFLRVQA